MNNTDLLKNIQFRNIITFLKNSGLRISAIWLVRQISDMSIPDTKKYVNGCHICTDGLSLKEKEEFTL